MSFMIKGQYRVYVIGFMDDHSRFIVGWGLYRFQTAANAGGLSSGDREARDAEGVLSDKRCCAAYVRSRRGATR